MGMTPNIAPNIGRIVGSWRSSPGARTVWLTARLRSRRSGLRRRWHRRGMGACLLCVVRRGLVRARCYGLPSGWLRSRA